MGEAVPVAGATCPDLFVPSVRGLTPSAPKVNGGREETSPEGLEAEKEKPDAEGKMEEVEEAAPNEKTEEEFEGRLNERPEEEKAGGAGAAVEAGGAEVDAGVTEDTGNGVKTGGGGLDTAGAWGGGPDSEIKETSQINPTCLILGLK